MLGFEAGTCNGSDLYFQSPSEQARSMLFYMTSCGYYYTDKDYQINRSHYPDARYLLIYIRSGQLSVTANSRTMIARRGQIILLDCSVPHTYHTIDHAEFVWIHLDGSNCPQLFEQVRSLYNSPVFDSSSATEVHQIMLDILYAWRNNQFIPEAQLSLRLYSIWIALITGNATQSYPDTGNAQTATEAAIQYIGEHYGESLTLPELARHVNMSQFYFSRLFKKQCGYSPHEYIILVRINRAKHLLKTTDQPVKVIANSVGYPNITTFSNLFSSRVGVSPSQFRKNPI